MKPMMPTLKTERLILRPFRMEDADAVQTHCGDRNIARMLTRVPHPYTLELAESWIASHDADWRSGDGVTFCIDRDGETVGCVGLQPNGEGSYELGYWIGEKWWGEGFATEAAQRVVGFAFGDLGAARLTSGYFKDNPASGRVLDKCGFQYVGESMEGSAARSGKSPLCSVILESGEGVIRSAAS